MKKILLMCFFVFSGQSNAAKEPLREVVDVVELPNMSQKQIFDASKIWMAQSFKSANDVVQYEDVSTGTIIGKGNMQYPCKGTWNCLANVDNRVFFTLKIDTKDNKARLTFNDLKLKMPTKANGGVLIKGYEVEIYVPKDKENIEQGLKDVINQYKNEIQTTSLDSDW